MACLEFVGSRRALILLSAFSQTYSQFQLSIRAVSGNGQHNFFIEFIYRFQLNGTDLKLNCARWRSIKRMQSAPRQYHTGQRATSITITKLPNCFLCGVCQLWQYVCECPVHANEELLPFMCMSCMDILCVQGPMSWGRILGHNLNPNSIRGWQNYVQNWE